MQLYKHQTDIISEDKKKVGLFLGTGSGKTLTALMISVGKVLVICPKTQKEDGNWERQLNELITKDGQRGIIYGGTIPLINPHIDLTVISKETFRRDHAKLPRYDTVIVDEAHTVLGATPNVRYVNRQAIPKTSQLFEALQSFINRTKPERIYLCTATIIRSPMTVWAAGTILGKKWDFYKFRDTFYFKLPMPGREIFQAKSDEKSKEHLGRIVRSIGYTGQLSDYFDVPDQTYKTVHVKLNEKQEERIKEIKIEYPDPIVQLGKIHQIENGVLSGDEFNEAESFDNEKMDKILDFALEFPRMVIFAKYRQQIAEIQAALEKQKYKVRTLTGDTKNRGDLLVEVNNMSTCIFIVQSSVSSGWQLGKTKDHPEYYDYNVMIFASMDYAVVNRIQGEGRILRSDNLKKNLYIDLVVKDGIDEAVFDCITNKKDFNERIYLKNNDQARI